MRSVASELSFHNNHIEELRELAGLYRSEGDLDRAREVYERILAVQESTLGAEHSDLAVTLYALSEILNDQGNYSIARPLYLRAVNILQRSGNAQLWDTGALFELHDAYLQSETGKRRIDEQVKTA